MIDKLNVLIKDDELLEEHDTIRIRSVLILKRNLIASLSMIKTI